jgi:integrase/recombinase XerD
LPERALQIINFYRKENSTGNDFIFPLLKIAPDEKSPEAIHSAISTASAYTNKNLYKLAELAGIEKHISFHTSRHTWATRALTKGMRIEHVSKLMGHTAIKETQVYAKIVNKELEQAMEIFNR